MKPLSCLGFCDARGDDSAEHWQGWIFNEEHQQPWNNGQAKEPPYPQPTLPASSSIKPSVNCHSSQLSRDYTRPLFAATFLPFLILSSHFTLSLQFCFSFPLVQLVLSFSRESCSQEKTNQGGPADILIHHQRFVWDTRISKSPMCPCEIIEPSVLNEHFKVKSIKEIFDYIKWRYVCKKTKDLIKTPVYCNFLCWHVLANKQWGLVHNCYITSLLIVLYFFVLDKTWHNFS